MGGRGKSQRVRKKDRVKKSQEGKLSEGIGIHIIVT